MNKKIKKIITKKNKSKLACLTAYSKSIANILDKHVDIILSVSKAIKKSLFVVDMPKGSYESTKLAKKNAQTILKKTKCDAVKLENNKNNFKIIKFLTKNKVQVMGHIGYTPQFKKKFRIEGQTKSEINRLLMEAKSIEKAGAFSIVLECLSPKAAKLITNELKIPTIGIGSSKYCDGQILVTDDMLGISGFYPKFVKKYLNLERLIEKSVKKYTRDVKTNKFPKKDNFLNGK